jgi:hypothetical protein
MFDNEMVDQEPDFESIKNPQVREYMKKKYAAAQNLKSAQQDQQQYGAISDAAGSGIETLLKANQSPTRYVNRWADKGKPQKVEQANDISIDTSPIQKALSRGVDQAHAGVQGVQKDFAEQQALTNYDRSETAYADENDPNSETSKQYQALAKKFMPNGNYEGASAAKLKQLMPPLEKAYQYDQQKAMRAEDLAERRKDRQTQYDIAQGTRQDNRQYQETQKQEERDYKEGLTAKAAEEKKKQSVVEIEDRRTNIQQNLGILKKMIQENGTFELMGSHNQDMNRLIEQVATDMAKLSDPSSVARPSEVEAVKATLVSPGFKNSNATAIKILDNFAGEVNRRADTGYKVRGLTPPSQQEAQTPGTTNTRTGNQVITNPEDL